MPASATTLKTTCGHRPTGDPRLASPSGQEGGCRRHAFFACLRLPLPWRPPVGTVRRGILSLPRRADRRVGAAGMRFLHACVCHYPEDHLWAPSDGGSSACLAERTGGRVPQARVLCMPASATTLKTTCGHGPTGDPRLASPSGQEGGCRRHALLCMPACARILKTTCGRGPTMDDWGQKMIGSRSFQSPFQRHEIRCAEFPLWQSSSTAPPSFERVHGQAVEVRPERGMLSDHHTMGFREAGQGW